jgi:hypothetical protein
VNGRETARAEVLSADASEEPPVSARGSTHGISGQKPTQNR